MHGNSFIYDMGVAMLDCVTIIVYSYITVCFGVLITLAVFIVNWVIKRRQNRQSYSRNLMVECNMNIYIIISYILLLLLHTCIQIPSTDSYGSTQVTLQSQLCMPIYIIEKQLRIIIWSFNCICFLRPTIIFVKVVNILCVS